METASNENKLLKFSMNFFIIYCFFSYIFKETVFGLQSYVYNCIIIFMFTFGILLIKYIRLKINLISVFWVPYLIYTMFGYAIQGNLESFIYWFVCFVILAISTRCELYKYMSLKLVFAMGIFFTIGVYVQYFLPDFYNANIATLFKSADKIEYWNKDYGLAGFSYQLDTTAVPALIGAGICLLFFGQNENNRKIQKKYVIIYLIMVAAVFMTGKRMSSFISVVAPLMAYFISQEKLIGKIKVLFGTVMVVTVLYYVIYFNIDYFYNTKALHRIIQSVFNIERNIDITSGRNNLSKIAISTYKEHPLTGIGIGNFIRYTHAYTDVHNTYLQVLCEQGIVGFVLYVIPLFLCLISTIDRIRVCHIQHLRKYLTFSLFIQLTYIMLSFSGNTNINMWGFCMYFIAIGVMMSCNDTKEGSVIPE